MNIMLNYGPSIVKIIVGDKSISQLKENSLRSIS